MTYPACFDSEAQYQAWVALAKNTGVPKRPGSTELNFCRDCTVFHKQDMRAQKRCAHPETVFVAIPEPAIGKFAPGFEIIGDDPHGAAGRESSPCADRSPLEKFETPPPIQGPSRELMGLLAAMAQQDKELSALTGLAQVPGPEPSQS